MNKTEATKTLADFIEFNKQDISNMTVDYPELGNIFGDLLVAIDKEYASGTIDKASLVVEPTMEIREPQEGDWYKGPNREKFQLTQLLPNQWAIVDPETGNDKPVTIDTVRGYIRDGQWKLTDGESTSFFGFNIGDKIVVVDSGKQYSGWSEDINNGKRVSDVANGEVGKIIGKASDIALQKIKRDVIEIQIDSTGYRYYINVLGVMPNTQRKTKLKEGDTVVVVNSKDVYSGMTKRVNDKVPAGLKNPTNGSTLVVVEDANKYFNVTNPIEQTVVVKSLEKGTLGTNFVMTAKGLRLVKQSTINTGKNPQDLVGYTLVDFILKYQFLEVKNKKGSRVDYTCKMMNVDTKKQFNLTLTQSTINKLLDGEKVPSGQYIEELQNGANLPRKAAPTPPPILKGMPDYKDAKNLVGLTLKFEISGNECEVTKLVKNNPKRIVYELRNIDSKFKHDSTFDRTLVEKLLRGEVTSNIKVIELQAIKAAAQTTTNVSPTQASETTTNLSDWRSTWEDDGKRASPQRSTKTNGELGMGYDGIVYERVPNVKGVYQWKKTKTNAFHDNTLLAFKKEDLQVLLDQLNYALTLFSKGDSEYDETQRQIERVTKELNKR